MEYTVRESDSIERIAAMHDCTVGELMKMNRLAARMVFPGQKLIVPSPMDENSTSDVISENYRSVSQATTAGNNTHSNEIDRIRRGPGTAVQICGRTAARADPSSFTLEKHRESQTYSENTNLTNIEEADTDCLKRFIKLKVKQMTEMDGTVTGTLLVTPNALMFDPDVAHPLVLENGQDLYIVMARMEEVMSVTMFNSVTALTDAEGDKGIYDSTHQSSSTLECSAIITDKETMNKGPTNLADGVSKSEGVHSARVFFDDMDLEVKRKRSQEAPTEHVTSDFKSMVTVKERKKLAETALDVFRTAARRTYSDSLDNPKQITHGITFRQKDDGMNTTMVSGCGEKQQYCSQPSTSEINADIRPTYSPLSKLGRTLSVHANTIRGSVTSGAERMTQSAVSGTKSVAHGVVSQSKAVAGTLQTGIQTSAKMAASHAKTAVVVVAAVPQGIASMSSGLFSTSQHLDMQPVQEKTVTKTRREQSLTTLLSLKKRTQMIREEAVRNKLFFCATSIDEMSNLSKSVHESLSPAQMFSTVERSSTVDSFHYMIVRLNKQKKSGKGRYATIDTVHSSTISEDVIRNRARQEFWFAIPKQKVDAIYHFLLQWNPEKYDYNIEEMNPKELTDQEIICELLEDPGFVVLDSEASKKFSG
uniref:LysM domain-containing protein n=1 Tax=Setaria digitata TaxID=48799 RepID=A0A915PYZ1_9BILA